MHKWTPCPWPALRLFGEEQGKEEEVQILPPHPNPHPFSSPTAQKQGGTSDGGLWGRPEGKEGKYWSVLKVGGCRV